MSKIIKVSHEDPVLRTFVLFMQVANAAYKYVDGRFYYGSRLTTPKFVALTVLISNGGKMTHTELANWTNTERHNITALVDRMKEDGLIATQQRLKDKRFIDICITDKGRTAQEEARSLARQIRKELMQGIGKNDALELERLLTTVKTNIEHKSEK
jgi:DNA-binding MarR family transcriptional regulator